MVPARVTDGGQAAGTIESVADRTARFTAVMAAITRRLPFGLSEVVAPSLLGYLVINLCTFFIDLTLLGVFHGTFRWPIPAAVTLSYGTASAISYVLNRVLNFHSHAAVGRQFPLFVAVSASNYLIFVLGLTDLLSALGVYYEFSRVLAACCEAVYLYCMFRWVVFRDDQGGSYFSVGGTGHADGPAAAVVAGGTVLAEGTGEAEGAGDAVEVDAAPLPDSRLIPPGGALSSRYTGRATSSIVSIPYCSEAPLSVSAAISFASALSHPETSLRGRPPGCACLATIGSDASPVR